MALLSPAYGSDSFHLASNQCSAALAFDGARDEDRAPFSSEAGDPMISVLANVSNSTYHHVCVSQISPRSLLELVEALVSIL